MSIDLLKIVVEYLPDFDAENEQHVQRAEKVLKNHLKINGRFSGNDIIDFINFCKNDGKLLKNVFEDENLSNIANKWYISIDSSKNKIFKFSEEHHRKWSKILSVEIEFYITQAIRKNDWQNLRIFYKQYFPVISVKNVERLRNEILQKNQIILDVILLKDCTLFKKQYPYAIQPEYYALQSDIDSIFFEPQIRKIINHIVAHQKTDLANTFFLGKILASLEKFDTADEKLRSVLKYNANLGKKWSDTNKELQENDGNSNAMTYLFVLLMLCILIFVLILLSTGNS